jgi:outer membrane protein OmpA-like peptidoglycan-associated protein
VQAPPSAEPPRTTQTPAPGLAPAPTTTPAPAPQQPAQPPGRQQAQPPAPGPQGPRGGQPPQQPTPAAPAPAALPPAAVPPPPQQPRDANQFIRRPGDRPTRTIQDLRQERQRVQQGNTTIIREGDRTIVRQGDRTIIRHQEADRFAVGARDVRTERGGNETVTVIVRPNGDRIITVTDPEGRLIRRVRREPNGREIVIIDEGFAGPRRDDFYIAVPPPRFTLPPDRYYVEVDRAPPQRIYETLIAPPFERFEGRYTVGQVRYSAPLRMLMPRIDLDINFDTGSWSLTPDQIERLSVIADAMNRAIERNPREVFLVEGHTDAVGADEDNLSLSDRRAESVAVALTEQFGVPPENMVTQGYGEQELKVPTMGPSRENRRVAVRRITPLLEGYAAR